MAACEGFIEPLNLQCWLVNVFAGDAFIFIAISFIAIMALAARFRMTTQTGLIMGALFVIIFAQFVPGIYLITILLIGLISFALIKTVVSRS